MLLRWAVILWYGQHHLSLLQLPLISRQKIQVKKRQNDRSHEDIEQEN